MFGLCLQLVVLQLFHQGLKHSGLCTYEVVEPSTGNGVDDSNCN